jgi:hypothetical protein
MSFHSTLGDISATRLRTILKDLPRAKGYRVELKPLRWRTRPHLQALCDWEAREITVQVPEPFAPFREPVAYRAKRVATRASRGKEKLEFRWFYRTVFFRTKTDVIRFLYCHEYFHYFLHDVLGRRGAAETACDRFALANFRRKTHTPPRSPRG